MNRNSLVVGLLLEYPKDVAAVRSLVTFRPNCCLEHAPTVENHDLLAPVSCVLRNNLAREFISMTNIRPGVVGSLPSSENFSSSSFLRTTVVESTKIASNASPSFR